MPSTGRPDNALLVFRWHFRDEGMALYPPKPLSERVEDGMSCPRRSAFFRSFRCLLTGCRKHANVVKVPWEQGLGAVPTTLRLYAKCFTPIRKTLYAYTQNEMGFPKVVLDWCTKVAPFLQSCTGVSVDTQRVTSQSSTSSTIFFVCSVVVY